MAAPAAGADLSPKPAGTASRGGQSAIVPPFFGRRKRGWRLRPGRGRGYESMARGVCGRSRRGEFDMKATGFFPLSGAFRRKAIAGVVGVAAVAMSAPAFADCQEDIGKYNQRRLAQVSTLNASAKKLKGKLDPVTACPQLRNLAAIERQMADYMTKNKEWCAIPDDAINTIRQSATKTGAIAGQACGAIAKMKQMQMQMRKQQEQQAQQGFGYQGPQKLPTGPL
jgi:hypothetical protein